MPGFINTSKGYINLELVAHIEQKKGVTHFIFIGPESDIAGRHRVELPREEAEKILEQLLDRYPQLFL
jgi:hypothetical protein